MVGEIRSDGRWGGALTSRPLPEASAELTELGPQVRMTLARAWWLQAATEARVATSFAIVHRSLQALNADPGLVEMAVRAIDDEHRHAALCEQLARTYAGHDLPPPPPLPHTQPAHALAESAQLRAALYVIGQCALNETLACAYLNLARAECTSTLPRVAIQELMKDEIDHSRIGWAYLHSIPVALKTRIDEWLLPLAICNLREWMSLTTGDRPDLVVHGVPDPDALRTTLEDAMRGIILPGFEQLGFDARAVERWIATGMRVT